MDFSGAKLQQLDAATTLDDAVTTAVRQQERLYQQARAAATGELRARFSSIGSQR
jgi:hypothetical protein